MTFELITIFPKIFDSYINESILKRARNRQLIKIKIHDLRRWTKDKHKTVDDSPYGGGAGMVMKVEPIYRALKALKQPTEKNQKQKKTKIILLSAKGKSWSQALARQYSKLERLIFICGRYEGVDQRVKKFVDQEISLGGYVLTGGELPALTIIDSITRLLPGALGNSQSPQDESHAVPGLLEYPHYTRPELFIAAGKRYRVPKVLLSGDHQKIAAWRRQKMKIRPAAKG